MEEKRSTQLNKKETFEFPVLFQNPYIIKEEQNERYPCPTSYDIDIIQLTFS